MKHNGYSRKDIIRFLQFQEEWPYLFLSKEDEFNGEFWGYDDEEYYNIAPIIPKEYNDNLKSDNW